MARALTPMEQRVFGVDAKCDQMGRPIEQGVGSAKQPTHPHAQALLKNLRANHAPAEQIEQAERLEQKMRGVGEDPTQVA